MNIKHWLNAKLARRYSVDNAGGEVKARVPGAGRSHVRSLLALDIGLDRRRPLDFLNKRQENDE